MTRIVEAEHRQAMLFGPSRERERLGARHVGEEARKPDKAKVFVPPRIGKAIGEAAAPDAVAKVEELRFVHAHLKNLEPCRR